MPRVNLVDFFFFLLRFPVPLLSVGWPLNCGCGRGPRIPALEASKGRWDGGSVWFSGGLAAWCAPCATWWPVLWVCLFLTLHLGIVDQWESAPFPGLHNLGRKGRAVGRLHCFCVPLHLIWKLLEWKTLSNYSNAAECEHSRLIQDAIWKPEIFFRDRTATKSNFQSVCSWYPPNLGKTKNTFNLYR